jgi:hypothetical protein
VVVHHRAFRYTSRFPFSSPTEPFVHWGVTRFFRGSSWLEISSVRNPAPRKEDYSKPNVTWFAEGGKGAGKRARDRLVWIAEHHDGLVAVGHCALIR